MRQILGFTLALCAGSLWAAVTGISPTERDFEAVGGAAAVTISGSGDWTAATDAGWIHLFADTGTAGSGSCVYTVDANETADTRVGVIDIAGFAHTVTQKGLPATLGTASATFGTQGGSGEVTVTVGTNVRWSAMSPETWVRVEPDSAFGPGTARFTVDPYVGLGTRQATLTIAGQPFTVTQTGVEAVVSPTQMTHGPESGIIQITVTADRETAWQATADVAWISFLMGAEGQGDGTVMAVLASNTGVETRFGVITIGGATLAVTQEGTRDYTLAANPADSAATPTGGVGTFNVLSTNGLGWKISQILGDWLTVTSALSGAGNGQVAWQATPNPGTDARTATIRVSARPPEPTIDLSRGLVYWSGHNDYVFNDSKGCGRDWKTDSTETMFFTVTSLNIIHHLFDFYNGKASLYINEANRVVYQDAGGPQVSDFVVKANTRYKVFLVRDMHNTDVYVGEDGVGPAVKLFRTGILDIFGKEGSGIGESSYPTHGYLVDGTADNCDYWDRTLSEAEVQAALLCTERPWAAKDTSKPPYEGLSHFYSLDGWARIEPTFGHHLDLTEDRYGWYGGAYKGALRSWDKSKIDSWWKTSEYTRDLGMSYDYDYYDSKEEAIAAGEAKATEEAIKNIAEHSAIIANAATYNFWCKWESAFVSTQLFSCYVYKCQISVSSDYRTSGRGYYPTNRKYTINLQDDPLTPCVSVDEDGRLSLLGTSVATTCEPNRWYMITVAIEGSTYELYLDGVQVATAQRTYSETDYPQFSAYPHFWELGGGSEVSYDDMLVYTRRLTGAEIVALYEAEKPLEVVHTVTQGAQSIGVSGEAMDVSAEGETRTVSVTAGAEQSWTATCEADWVTVSPASGKGNGTVSLTIAPNASTAPRTATARIAGRDVRIAQLGRKAEVSTSDPLIVGSDGGGLTLKVDVAPDTAWTTTEDSGWMTVIAGQTGSGDGTATIVIDPNTQAGYISRTDAITIAGETVYVTQRDFDLTLSPAAITLPSTAARGEIAVSAPTNTQWDVLSTVPWLTVASPTGFGSGTLTYTVAANETGAERTGTILVAGERHTVTQKAGAVVTVEAVGEGSVSGGGEAPGGTEVTLTATPAEGHVFSHWSGDASGSANPLTVTAEGAMRIQAHFIPQATLEAILAEGGYFTEEQLRDLAFGAPVIAVEDDAVRVGFRLRKAATLSGDGAWQDALPENVELDEANGVITVTLPKEGNAAFYRFVTED